MKSRVTLFCNGHEAISCDLEGLKKDQIDDIAENLLICCISRAIDELKESEFDQFIESIKSFDYGIKIEKIIDDSSSPYKFTDAIFDFLGASARKFLKKE